MFITVFLLIMIGYLVFSFIKDASHVRKINKKIDRISKENAKRARELRYK